MRARLPAGHGEPQAGVRCFSVESCVYAWSFGGTGNKGSMDTTARAVSYPGERDISILDFSRALMRDWWLIAAIVALAAVSSIIVALLLPPRYRAEAVIVEVGEGGGGAAAMLAPLGGLAGLAGLDVAALDRGSGRARAILNSRMLVEEFISRNDLLPVIFDEQWDSTTRKWATDPEDAPTLWLGVRTFVENIRTVREDPAAGVIRVGVDWKDPEAAAEWANGLVALANEIVRTRDLTDAERNLTYLNNQIARTNVVELQQVLYSLIETEMKTMMLANVKDEYAFAVIDPAVPPERRAFPHRAFVVVVGIILGFFIALLVVLLRLIARKQQVSRDSHS
ncbi:hypothetical protein BH24PSE2_BH24PSE2_03150 [soil metagenome]